VVSVIETHKHQGDFRELVSFARIASHSPLKGGSMIPLSSDSSQASWRIMLEKPVIKGGIFPPNYS
jgi:hypothetical protein